MTNDDHSALFSQVDPGYRHYPKWVQPTTALALPNVYLKWHLVYPETLALTQAQIDNAQSYLSNEIAAARLMMNNEIGFVIQHRCPDWEILYVCTWRGNNEVWETLYHKDLKQGTPFAEHQRANTSGTFCVWVLPVVMHEQKAWVRFLSSERTAVDQTAYRQDQFSGWV